MSWFALAVAVYAVLRLRALERTLLEVVNSQVRINDHMLEMLKGKR